MKNLLPPYVETRGAGASARRKRLPYQLFARESAQMRSGRRKRLPHHLLARESAQMRVGRRKRLPYSMLTSSSCFSNGMEYLRSIFSR